MAQRMIHLLAYHCEDGAIISVHENHVERDQDYEEAQAEWRAMGEEGDSPTLRLDTMVPLEATHEQISAMIQRATRSIMMKRMIMDFIEDLIK